MIDAQPLDLDDDKLFEVTKALFYGFTVVAAASILRLGNPEAFLGLAILSSVAMVSAGLANGLEEDWSSFLEVISVSSLLMVLLLSSFGIAIISFV